MDFFKPFLSPSAYTTSIVGHDRYGHIGTDHTIPPPRAPVSKPTHTIPKSDNPVGLVGVLPESVLDLNGKIGSEVHSLGKTVEMFYDGHKSQIILLTLGLVGTYAITR